MVYYHCQGEIGSERQHPILGLEISPLENLKKFFTNPLTNRPRCDTIKAQREDETLTETFRSADERTICYGKGTLQKTPCQFRKSGTPMRLKPARQEKLPRGSRQVSSRKNIRLDKKNA